MLLLISFGVQSQNLTITCGIKIEKGSTVVLDTLKQDCYKTLLLQDNSILEIRYIAQLDSIKFTYGDTGGDTLDGVEYEILREYSVDSISWTDKRPVGDVNPKVIIHDYTGDKLFFSDHVDVEYVYSYLTADTDTDIPEEDLKKLECKIYSFLGQIMYEGKFGDLFQGTQIDCRFSSKLLLIRFYNNSGSFPSKRYYVDLHGTGGCD